MPIPFYHPKPAPPEVFNKTPLPISGANVFSKLIVFWILPILRVGYSRPLEINGKVLCDEAANALFSDLYQLTDDFRCEPAAALLHENLMKRLPPSKRFGFSPSPKQDTEAYDAEKVAMPDSSSSSSSSLTLADTAATKIDPKSANTGGIDTYPPVQNGQDGKVRAMEELIKKYGKRTARKIAAGKIAEEDGVIYDMSLLKAMIRTIWSRYWQVYVIDTIGYGAELVSPLITNLILAQLTLAYDYHHATSTEGLQAPKSVGYGIGLAFVLFILMAVYSTSMSVSFLRAQQAGYLLRVALIDLVSRKSMRLSEKSRLDFTSGRLITTISTDTQHIETSLASVSDVILLPVVIVVGVALLIKYLGYSALVGLGVLLMAIPMQTVLFNEFFKNRKSQLKFSDSRVRLLTEVISNVRAVKLYCYEAFFGERVNDIRRKELNDLRKNGLNNASINSTISFIPILAAVLTFVTYGLTGHELNATVIFTGLSYFNILKMPLYLFPLFLTSLGDALVSTKRIKDVLCAEELGEEIKIDKTAEFSIVATGDFQFESSETPGDGKEDNDIELAKRQKKEARKLKKEAANRAKSGLPSLETAEEEKSSSPPFALRGIDLQIPRGSLVCVVGRIGAGKTALMSGLIKEMRQLHGHVVFGGAISYVPQQAWVQSGTIKSNIAFCHSDDEIDHEHLDKVVDACGLRTDLEMWADGLMTVIGEKGITLSGGQRQRICLARAAYNKNTEVVLLDDPLSAVDANVGHHILHNCILQGPLSTQTRVLVTHHLEVLPHADHIVVMDQASDSEGRIAQQGTYEGLLREPGIFSSLIEEFGSSSEEEAETAGNEIGIVKKTGEKKNEGDAVKLIMDEERAIGTVSWGIYWSYLRSMDSWWTVALLCATLILTQVATVGNSLFLGFWSGNEIPGLSQGSYMGLYAGFGGAVAVFSWITSYTFVVAGLRASTNMFNGAWNAVLRSPTTWHDRTPSGRIINRLSKDVSNIDEYLPSRMNSFLSSSLSVVGTFALIVYSFPWLGLFYIPLVAVYYIFAAFYRASSRELKRLDSLQKSLIYSSFSEQLAGLAVIRAFGQQDDFKRRMQECINTDGISVQRWLSIHLNFLSDIVVLMVAIFGCIFRETVSPAKLGVVLTYTISVSFAASQLVVMFATVEQDMNNVERLKYYNELQLEAAPSMPSDPPKKEWPAQGAVEFQDVQLRYRPELPLVLKGLSFKINPGEKIGIVGRTGAGKSSLAQALFRTVELSGGKITVDGRVLGDMGLDIVRTQLAIIPQDAFLWQGTIRENIDPFGLSTDAVLNDSLNLINKDPNASTSLADKFKLDTEVQNEGANFSAGERQLLALIRALVRGCKVLLLDEATSSVDLATDALIQRIIQTQFSHVTLISIAHRLQTVAFYDRILVMDAGAIAEFDSPLALFDAQESIFRSLCEKARLSRAELVRIQNEALAARGA